MIQKQPGAMLTEIRATEVQPQIEQESDLDARRKNIAFQHGEYFDSYLVTEPGREEFWSSNGKGLISYKRVGKCILVGGGVVAPVEHRAALVGEFLEFTKSKRYRVAFHNIGAGDLPMFREQGFEITKWGEEPVIDLGSVVWKGKAYEWVRRQSNYCLREGVRAFEVPHAELTAEQWKRTLDEMLEVSAESLAHKPQRKEMRFFEGHIGDHEVGLRRVFIARSNEGMGRIEGFVVCTPMRDGSMWATELYRRRTDAVRGTMAFLFHTLQEKFQQEGVKQLNLCLDPGLRCGTKLAGDSPLIRFGMTWGEICLSYVFDVAGLRHFKSRFRPRYEERFVCAYPKASVRSLLAFAKVSGLFDVDFGKLMRVTLQRLRKVASRSTLAKVQ